MKQIIDHKIITIPNIGITNHDINNYSNEGYELYGNPFLNVDGIVCQTIVKYGRERIFWDDIEEEERIKRQIIEELEEEERIKRQIIEELAAESFFKKIKRWLNSRIYK